MVALRFPLVALQDIFTGLDETPMAEGGGASLPIRVYNKGDFVAEDALENLGLKLGEDVEYREGYEPPEDEAEQATPKAAAALPSVKYDVPASVQAKDPVTSKEQDKPRDADS